MVRSTQYRCVRRVHQDEINFQRPLNWRASDSRHAAGDTDRLEPATAAQRSGNCTQQITQHAQLVNHVLILQHGSALFFYQTAANA